MGILLSHPAFDTLKRAKQNDRGRHLCDSMIVMHAAARGLFAIVMLCSVAALGHVVGVASPWFALIASFCVLGFLDLVMPLVRIRLPRPLRLSRPWEVRSAVYRAMGVPVFGAILRGTPLRMLNKRVYMNASYRDLRPVRTHLENAEAAHFWGGMVTLPYLILAWAQEWWSALTSVVLFNLLVNVYPILHLRSVRARIERREVKSRKPTTS